MPRHDHTTSHGQGTRAGWGRVHFVKAEELEKDAFGPGPGRQFGGWGRRHAGCGEWSASNQAREAAHEMIIPTPEQELANLKNAAELLKGDLEMVNRRIAQLEQKESADEKE